MQLYDKIVEAADYIKKLIAQLPDTAIVLGTGLGDVDNLVDPISINYIDIPHFSSSTVESHDGQICFGTWNGTNVLVLKGRFHYYEGYSMEEVTFPIRLLAYLGIQNLIITNAAGSLNQDLKTGDIVMVEDHISFFGPNPLRGVKDPRLGERFPDMTKVYDVGLKERVDSAAKSNSIEIKKGVYAYVQGPSLETPAELRLLRTVGADLVGMSTVPEVIVAKQCAMKICVLSCITNECLSADGPKETSLEEVILAAKATAPTMKALIKNLIAEI